MPFSRASDLIGLMQSIGGALSFVAFMPFIRFSDISLLMLFGFVFGSSAAFSQISFAVPAPTLVNSCVRNACNVLEIVFCSILINIPSSTP